MSKFRAIALIVVGVIVSYLILTVAMPVITGVIATANASMGASSNMSNYPGTQEGILYAPLFLYLAPAAIGIVAIVVVLKWRGE